MLPGPEIPCVCVCVFVCLCVGRKDISVQDVFRGVTPFFAADVLTIAVLIAVPSIVLWLPSMM